MNSKPRYYLLVNGKPTRVSAGKLVELASEIAACLAAGDKISVKDSLRKKDITQEEIVELLGR